MKINYDEFQWFTPSFIGVLIDEYQKNEKEKKRWEYCLFSMLAGSWGVKTKDFDSLFEESTNTGKVIEWQEDRHNIKS